ncbi:MAG: hypothetical protein ACXWX6_02750 [Actinomycetota bacterium]
MAEKKKISPKAATGKASSSDSKTAATRVTKRVRRVRRVSPKVM